MLVLPMDRPLVLGIVLTVGCGPSVGIDETVGGSDDSGTPTGPSSAGNDDVSSGVDASDSSGSAPAVCGDGIVDDSEACDDGNLDDGDGCDSQCRVPGTELWQVFLPTLWSCPRLAVLDDGGIAVVGNERPVRDSSIPHIVVIDIDGSVRWGVQGGHWKFDHAADVVAEPGGFVVVGQGDGASKGYLGWMQRWTADGTMVAEAILGVDEPGDQIDVIERRDATSYWIVAADDAISPTSLFFRSFDEPPVSAIGLDPSAFEVRLARAPDEGVYVAVNGDDSTLSRFGREGDARWALQYESPIDSESGAYALASMMTGDVIVSGTDQGDQDVQWIRRFDSEGTELWRTNVDVSAVPSADHPRFVAVDAADSIVVTGESWVERDAGNTGFLAKYAGDGIELWQHVWLADEGLNAKSCDVATTSDGSIVVAGTEFLAGEDPDAYWLRAFTP